MSLSFKTSCCNLKVRGLGAKVCVWLFYYFDFEINYDALKSKSPCLLLNKNTNFNKNETELKMENSTHTFRDEPCVSAHQRMANSKQNWVEANKRKKECIFCNVYFDRRDFFNICNISQCIVYQINVQNIHIFTY